MKNGRDMAENPCERKICPQDFTQYPHRESDLLRLFDAPDCPQSFR